MVLFQLKVSFQLVVSHCHLDSLCYGLQATTHILNGLSFEFRREDNDNISIIRLSHVRYPKKFLFPLWDVGQMLDHSVLAERWRIGFPRIGPTTELQFGIRVETKCVLINICIWKCKLLVIWLRQFDSTLWCSCTFHIMIANIDSILPNSFYFILKLLLLLHWIKRNWISRLFVFVVVGFNFFTFQLGLFNWRF